MKKLSQKVLMNAPSDLTPSSRLSECPCLPRLQEKARRIGGVLICFLITVTPTRISLFDTQKWSLHVHYIEHRFNKEIQKSVEKTK